MITIDASKLIKSLEEAKLLIKKRLEHMVIRFTLDATHSAIGFTPLGDSVTFEDWYKARTLLPQVEGIAKGNWQVSLTGGMSLQLISGQDSGDAAERIAFDKMQGFQLGNTVYLGNTAPYFDALENNSSKQTGGKGIKAPTLAVVTGVYSLNLSEYYKQGAL